MTKKAYSPLSKDNPKHATDPVSLRNLSLHIPPDGEDCEKITDPNKQRTCRVNDEYHRGVSFISRHPKSVTFFGSARIKDTDPLYTTARNLAGRIVRELGYAIVTGGGGGIMEAANRGAEEAGGTSLGLTIQLPHEQHPNKYLTDSEDFYYFFTRKVALAFSAEAYIYFPGGFGTMDEFFELLTLVQTRKIAYVPLILFDTKFWSPLRDHIQHILLDTYHTISDDDLNLVTITDDPDVVIATVQKADVHLQ